MALTKLQESIQRKYWTEFRRESYSGSNESFWRWFMKTKFDRHHPDLKWYLD